MGEALHIIQVATAGALAVRLDNEIMTEQEMPSKTPRQRRAMRSAAAGKSTLGIPRKVGKEFVKADQRKARKKRKR